MECLEAVEKVQAGDVLAVDFNTGEIVNQTRGETYRAEPFPEFMQDLIAAGGLLRYIKEQKE